MSTVREIPEMPRAWRRTPERYRDMDMHNPPADPPAWLERLRRCGVWFGLLHDGTPRLSEAEHQAMHEPPPSFAQFLPVLAWDPQTRLFLLQNWPAAAAILELEAVDAEARSSRQLEEMLDRMVSAFSGIPERRDDPWIVQLYLTDEPLLDAARRLERYSDELGSVRDRFGDHFLDIMRSHLLDIGRPGGIFEDTHTGVRWGGRMRRCRLVLYRRFDREDWPDRAGRWPVDELDELVRNLAHGLDAAGIFSRRIAPGAWGNWMFPWLQPTFAGMDSWEFLSRHGVPDEHVYPDLYDLSMAAVRHFPVSDLGRGVWWHMKQPHRYLPVVGMRTEPRPGLLTLERSAGRGRTAAAFLDHLPPETVFTLQMVFQPQDRVAEHLDFIARRSRSAHPESALARQEVGECLSALHAGNVMLPVTMGFYLRGRDLPDLEERVARVIGLCTAEGIETVAPDSDLFPCDSYVRHLPAGYDRRYNRYLMRERYQWLANALAASPLWGKARGSGRPGMTFFDRSGQPVLFDILHKADRDKAPHCLIVGPTGTGKSALLNYLALQVMAVHRPHLYIVDVGDSFRLLGEWFRSHGLTVNHVRLDRGDVSLPPFASSERLLEDAESPDDGEGEDGVDLLREMEVAARMLITGCNPQEEAAYKRRDQTYVRAAIMDAARTARDRGAVHASVTDFVEQIGRYARGEVPWGFRSAADAAATERLQEIHDSAKLTLDGVRRRLFDRPGDPWPEVDVTIVDFGNFAGDEDTRDILSIAFIGLMNRIQRDAERRRGSGRQSVVMIDEAHVTTTNPLLADYLTRGSKMWRKWGLWLWLATQSLSDFPDDAQKILGMCEFWICLSMPKEEIGEIARFRRLSEEDRLLLEEARKAPDLYSEGVLLSGRPPMLIRNVPPAIAMALAQTEESEVAERMRLMREHDLATELEAVELVAGQIRERRLG